MEMHKRNHPVHICFYSNITSTGREVALQIINIKRIKRRSEHSIARRGTSRYKRTLKNYVNVDLENTFGIYNKANYFDADRGRLQLKL